MLKDKLKGFISGVVVMTLVFGGMTVFAASVTKAINITYRDIKLVIDGAAYTPKDGNGNIVEPFIYNGTTYLPLKAVSNALGKDVTWDGNTSTVYIGNNQAVWLDEVGTYVTSSTYGTCYSESIGQISDKDNKRFERAVRFVQKVDGNNINDELGMTEITSNDYTINGKYSKLTGNIFCSRDYSQAEPSIVKIYGDGKLLYTSPGLVEATKTMNVEIDIQGVNRLVIEVSTKYNGYYNGGNNTNINILDDIDRETVLANMKLM